MVGGNRWYAWCQSQWRSSVQNLFSYVRFLKLYFYSQSYNIHCPFFILSRWCCEVALKARALWCKVNDCMGLTELHSILIRLWPGNQKDVFRKVIDNMYMCGRQQFSGIYLCEHEYDLIDSERNEFAQSSCAWNENTKYPLIFHQSSVKSANRMGLQIPTSHESAVNRTMYSPDRLKPSRIAWCWWKVVQCMLPSKLCYRDLDFMIIRCPCIYPDRLKQPASWFSIFIIELGVNNAQQITLCNQTKVVD